LSVARPDPAVPEAHVPRKLGRWMTVSLVIGNMIGSGVYLLPASLALFGWNSVFGWALTIAGGLCLAASFAWLAGRMPVDGGPYGYTLAAFGPLPAFMVTWSYWVSNWIGVAAVVVGGVSYVGAIFPGIAAVTGGEAVVACLGIAGLTALNLSSTRSVGRFQLVTTVIKVIPLVLVIVLAVGALGTGEASIRPLDTGDLSLPAVTAAATLTLWALLGLESATVPAGRIEDPEVTIPFATIVGTALTGLLYLLTCSAVILLMDPAAISASGAPFADFVTRFWSPGPALLIAAFAAVSCFGAANGWILITGELPYAMARSGHFPRWFAQRDARGIPRRALIFSAVLMTIVVLMNYDSTAAEAFGFLLLISTCCSLFMYLVCMAAALKLRFGGGWISGRLLPWIAGLGVIYSAWTIYGAGGEAVVWGLLLLLVSLPIYFVLGRKAPPMA